jgi:hypothetical protein
METKVELDSDDDKKHFFHRHDIDFRLIFMSISPEIQYNVISLSTPNEVWTKLEVLFGINKYCEECLQYIDKTNLVEMPTQEQAS